MPRRASAAASTSIRQVTDALADEAADGRLVVVETTVLDIDRGEPAIAHVRASLEGLAHVVTANKGPAAFAYDELEALAESVDRVFLFEGAVMDGVPVFNLVRETMPAVTIEGFRGVINTTCNYVLAEMERGMPFDDAMAEMQARGIAEADPSLDIDGWDAAAKTAALVNVLMGGRDHAARRRAHRHSRRRRRAKSREAVARAGTSGWSPPRRGATAGSTRGSSRSCSIRAIRSPASAAPKTRSSSTPICSATSASCSARHADADRLRAAQRLSRISRRLREL